jgi:hypothetical protein
MKSFRQDSWWPGRDSKERLPNTRPVLPVRLSLHGGDCLDLSVILCKGQCFGFRLHNSFMAQMHHMIRPDRGHLQVHWGLYNHLFSSATLYNITPRSNIHTLSI